MDIFLYVQVTSPGREIEEVYYLQSYKEGWKDGRWEEKMDFRDCNEQNTFVQVGFNKISKSIGSTLSNSVMSRIWAKSHYLVNVFFQAHSFAYMPSSIWFIYCVYMKICPELFCMKLYWFSSRTRSSKIWASILHQILPIAKCK